MPSITSPPQRFEGPWVLIAALAITCAFASYGVGFHFEGLALPGLSLLLLTGAMIIGRVTDRPRLYAGASAFLLMSLFTILGVILSYALAARAGALWDGDFARADRYLGFDWPAVLTAADDAPVMLWIGGVAYHSLPLQMVVCIVALSGTGKVATLTTAVTAAIISGFVTILVSGLMPGTGYIFDPTQYTNLWPSVAWIEREMIAGLRDGSWRTVDLTQLWGIVTFPSYHATLPIILAWGLRELPWLRIIAPIWAGVTIIATPLFGGHHGVDVIAGIAIAPIALFTASSNAWRNLHLIRKWPDAGNPYDTVRTVTSRPANVLD